MLLFPSPLFCTLFGQKNKEKSHFIQTEKLHFAHLYFCLPEVIDNYQNMTKDESYFTFSVQICDHPFKSTFIKLPNSAKFMWFFFHQDCLAPLHFLQSCNTYTFWLQTNLVTIFKVWCHFCYIVLKKVKI